MKPSSARRRADDQAGPPVPLWSAIEPRQQRAEHERDPQPARTAGRPRRRAARRSRKPKTATSDDDREQESGCPPGKRSPCHRSRLRAFAGGECAGEQRGQERPDADRRGDAEPLQKVEEIVHGRASVPSRRMTIDETPAGHAALERARDRALRRAVRAPYARDDLVGDARHDGHHRPAGGDLARHRPAGHDDVPGRGLRGADGAGGRRLERRRAAVRADRRAWTTSSAASCR